MVSFEKTDYTVNEADGSVEVCIQILEPNTTDILIFGYLVSMAGTALGMSTI